MDCGLFGVRFLFFLHKKGAVASVDYQFPLISVSKNCLLCLKKAFIIKELKDSEARSEKMKKFGK